MMKEMSFIITSLAETRKSANAFPRPLTAEAASPIKIAKIISASMLFLERRFGKSETVKAFTICSEVLNCSMFTVVPRLIFTPTAGG